MQWLSFGSAGVLFLFAVLCAWTAWMSGRPTGGTAATERGTSSLAGVLARRLMGVSAPPVASLWWGCAQFVLLGSGAAVNGIAQLDQTDKAGWWLTAVAVLLMASGVVAGVSAFRKRSGKQSAA